MAKVDIWLVPSRFIGCEGRHVSRSRGDFDGRGIGTSGGAEERAGTCGVATGLSVVGGIVGIVGFFVVPVVGLILGFILGAMVSELVRGWSFEQAWRGAVAAMKAAGASMLVELSGALIATTIWLVGAFVF